MNTRSTARTAQSAGLVGGLTLGSRLLGLARDSLLFSALGASGINSAFLMAFTLPNLFRRLLGEGALTTALIPALSRVQEKDSQQALNVFVSQVLTRLVLVLLATVGILTTWLMALTHIPGLPQRWYWAATMGIVLLPYLLFVCLTAALSAVLNCKERFGLGAASPVWLNVCMIGALIWGFRYPEGLERAWSACAGVLLGGVFQTGIVVWACWRQGLRLGVNLQRSKDLNHWLNLFIPGLWGASVLQLNIVISRLLAFSVDASATAILYLANRLIELPLGMFTMAIASVIFPRLSRQAAQQEHATFAQTYQEGLSLTLAITIPAALGLIVLSEPILLGLFQWGAFVDPRVAQIPLCFFAASIPFYSISILATRATHALGDARFPARLALYSLGLNVFLSLLLMPVWETTGLAAANLFTILAQSLVMHRYVRQKHAELKHIHLRQPRIWFSASLMALITAAAWNVGPRHATLSKPHLLLALVGLVTLGVIVYAILLWACTGFSQVRIKPKSQHVS